MKIIVILSVLLVAIAQASVTPLNTSAKFRIQKGGRCDRDPRWCARGLSCVGNPGNRKCFAKRTLNMKCGHDPFWVCAHGLVCQHHVCKNRPIGVGGACNKPGDVCRRNLSCVGNIGNKKCFRKRRAGQKCGKDPFWVCDHNLLCEYGICVIPVKGACRGRNAPCARGLSCVGNRGNMKCFRKRQKGEKCGKDPFWVCQAGLSCIYNVCH